IHINSEQSIRNIDCINVVRTYFITVGVVIPKRKPEVDWAIHRLSPVGQVALVCECERRLRTSRHRKAEAQYQGQNGQIRSHDGHPLKMPMTRGRRDRISITDPESIFSARQKISQKYRPSWISAGHRQSDQRYTDPDPSTVRSRLIPREEVNVTQSFES